MRWHCLGHRCQCSHGGKRNTLEVFLTVYLSARRKPDKPVCSLRVSGRLSSEGGVPTRRGALVSPAPFPSVGNCPVPQWSKLPSLTGVLPRASHSAGASAKGQVPLVQLNEEQTGGAGVSRFQPEVHCVFCRLWVEIWQKSREDTPQCLRATLNPQSLNFS